MTRLKTFRLGIYTALALGANSISAADVPADWVNYKSGKAPLPVVEVAFVGSETEQTTIPELVKDTPDGKVFVLNFWATWCGPCRAEMPSLDELQTNADPTQVEVITVATGRNPPEMIKRFFDRSEVKNLPTYRDPKGALADAYGVVGLPVTVILNAKGQEIARMQGEADWASAEALTFLVGLGE